MKITKAIILPAVFLMIFCLPKQLLAQDKLSDYTSSNGFLFAPDDSITLGVSSMPDGTFASVAQAMLILPFNIVNIQEGFRNWSLRGSQYYGAKGLIRSIRKVENRVYFLVHLNEGPSYILDIELAIETCEVAACRQKDFLNQDEFEKLMLLNNAAMEGSLSEERYQKLRNDLIHARD